jgi:hypothetical protein
MRLVYENDHSREVKVGDEVTLEKSGEKMFVTYFREPRTPASEGKVSVHEEKGGQFGPEYYVSVIGAVWIEREDRPADDDFDDGSGEEEVQNPPKSPEKGLNFSVVNRDEFEFEAVHDNDNDWVLYSPDIESCEGNSREQMDHVVAVVNQAPAMLRALRELRSTAYDSLTAEMIAVLEKLDHVE